MQETTKKAIEGKVAKILNSRELVINRGSDSGVKKGMKFEVIEEFEEVLDPDTQTSLGNITRQKVRIKIDHVQPCLSIGRTYQTYQVSSGLFPNLGVLAALSHYAPTTRVRTLRSSEECSGRPMEEGDSYVEIGDKVVQIDDEGD
ncbi:MAG: hypothetical protein IIB16_02195 [Chloroflexi bacterium]|nr:hypothetical protein [Chloroflexota bacterium]